MTTPEKSNARPAARKAPPVKHYEELVGLGAICGGILGAMKGPEAMLAGMGVGAMVLAAFCYLVARNKP